MNLDYLAGLIDGEGCLTISRRTQYNKITYRPYLTITNTDKSLIDHVADYIKKLGIKAFRVQHDNRGTNRRDCFVVSLGGGSALQLAKILGNRLVSKSHQQNVLMRYYETFQPSNKTIGEDGRRLRQQLMDEIQWLNQGCP